MTKPQLIALQCGILAVIVAILFPPYGYERVVSGYFPPAKVIQLGASYSETTNAVPWRYVGHSFILSTPLRDGALEWRSKETEGKWLEAGKSVYHPEIKIGGHVLTAEIAVIVLLTAGAFITLGYKRKSANVG